PSHPRALQQTCPELSRTDSTGLFIDLVPTKVSITQRTGFRIVSRALKRQRHIGRAAGWELVGRIRQRQIITFLGNGVDVLPSQSAIRDYDPGNDVWLWLIISTGTEVSLL